MLSQVILVTSIIHVTIRIKTTHGKGKEHAPYFCSGRCFIQQSRLETAIEKVAQAGGIKYKRLEIFGKPRQLLDAISETGSHQFFFLDIEIKDEEKKGMEIAKEIRARDPQATIVFVTTHSEFMPLTFRYRVAAMDFIDPHSYFYEPIYDHIILVAHV